MRKQIIEILEKSISKLGVSDISIELTDSKGHADFSTNIAMKISNKLNDSSINIAKKIVENISENFINKIEIAGPGFINIFLTSNATANIVDLIIKKGNDFGKLNQKRYINVEYVSANPTGFLHLGHARGAAIGSTLVNILRFAGNKVDAEYYINDAGNQIDLLGYSVWIRYMQLFDIKIDMPIDSYKGNDIIECAKHLISKFGAEFKNSNYENVKNIFKDESQKYLLEIIKNDLENYRVKFDIYFSERDLYEKNLIRPSLEKISNFTYELNDAFWLKTTLKGDDKDRVLIKSTGEYTYFAPDIAYHNFKLSRGYTELINVWGADHIGYIKRMEIALEFLGLPKNKLDILIIQLVKLFKNGEEIKMSKRMGTSFTLKELIEEVGVDAIRWFMIDRSNTSEFVFDINKANERNVDNPVFTVQYTHARANQLINKSVTDFKAKEFHENEIELINLLNKFPELINTISYEHKVHLLPQYLLEICREFNSWYSSTDKIIGNAREDSMISLVLATKIVLANGLSLMGISAPNKM